MSFVISYYILYTLSIIGIFVLAILVYSKRREAEYKNFTIFALLLDVWLALQFLAQVIASGQTLVSTILLRIVVAVGPFFALYFFFFAIEYVGVKKHKKFHFILPIICAVLALTTNLMLESASAVMSGITLHEGPLYYVVSAFVVLYVLISVGYIIQGGRNTKLNASKRQANIILSIGTIQAALIIGLVLTIFTKEALAQVSIPFALFLMVATFSYAIVRHRLFDIRLAAVRALAYSFSLMTLAALYSLLTFGLANAFLGYQDNLSHQLFYLVIALLLALTFAPLKNFFDKATRSIFYQDAYDPQKVIDSLSNVLVSTVDINELGKQAGDILQNAIKSQYVAIVLPQKTTKDKKEKTRIILTGHDGALNKGNLYKQLLRIPGKVVTQEDFLAEKGTILKSMQAANCAVAARLEAHNDVIGFMLFGEKNNGRPYTSQDIELIHTTSDEIALGIQNALRFEEIREFNHTLQERIEDATAQLRRKNVELRRLDVTKDEFVSMASHQLRTPLTSVKGYISMVLEGDAGKITKMQSQLLGEAFTSSERMVHLINDFLNVSRLQTGKFLIEARQADLSKVVQQEVDSLQTTAHAHNMKLQYRAPSRFPVLYIDEAKIRQVLMNFIDNAIYYSKERTTISVKLTVEDGDAVLTVRDTGIGVPKNEQAHLFTKFFRATNARRQRPDGTGVGLFLAKKVVVAHGGSMVFESAEGEGSTFGFRLPVKKLSAAPKNTDKLEKQPEDNKKDS